MGRSLRLLRERGYHCEKTEHWNPFAKIRNDLWGFCDILALEPPQKVELMPGRFMDIEGGILAVQTTSYSNLSARVKKIQSSKLLKKVLDCGIEVVVHGWKAPTEKNKKWTVKEVFVTA